MLILPVIMLAGCSPVQCPHSAYPIEERYNTEEPTLQSAEDAMRTKFDENSFNK
jgi:hypothetical protein